MPHNTLIFAVSAWKFGNLAYTLHLRSWGSMVERLDSPENEPETEESWSISPKWPAKVPKIGNKICHFDG